jgi:hypothetical protein
MYTDFIHKFHLFIDDSEDGATLNLDQVDKFNVLDPQDLLDFVETLSEGSTRFVTSIWVGEETKIIFELCGEGGEIFVYVCNDESNMIQGAVLDLVHLALQQWAEEQEGNEECSSLLDEEYEDEDYEGEEEVEEPKKCCKCNDWCGISW